MENKPTKNKTAAEYGVNCKHVYECDQSCFNCDPNSIKKITEISRYQYKPTKM